jgi:PadR family transcriptional regulator, regulatory protein PadR
VNISFLVNYLRGSYSELWNTSYIFGSEYKALLERIGNLLCVTNRLWEGKMITLSEKETRTELTKRLIDLIIMHLLDREPMYGYQIIISIRQTFGVHLGSSTIYPLLNSLEQSGYLKSEWRNRSGRNRKFFFLSAEGQTALKNAKNSLSMIQVFQARIEPAL